MFFRRKTLLFVCLGAIASFVVRPTAMAQGGDGSGLLQVPEQGVMGTIPVPSSEVEVGALPLEMDEPAESATEQPAKVDEAEQAKTASSAIRKSLKIEKSPKAKDKTFEEALSENMAILDKLSPETRDEILAEADQMYHHCSTNITMSAYYDCSCYAMKMVDYRLNKGPDVSNYELMTKGDFKECVSEPLIAGNNYMMCVSIMTSRRVTDKQLEDICQCAGRMVASRFKQQPVMNVEYTGSLFSESLGACNSKYAP